VWFINIGSKSVIITVIVESVDAKIILNLILIKFRARVWA
jgi:hypothetical protein